MPIVAYDKNDLSEVATLAAQIVLEQARTEFNKPFPEIMTIEQVCRYTQYSRPTILKFIREQDFPVSRPCESMRFFKSEVNAWMKERS